MPADSITLIQPDDWHLHLRSGSATASVLPHTIQHFRRAIVMPNLKPPVTTIQDAEIYYGNIKSLLPPDSDFEPLMSLYLTPATSPELVQEAARHPHIFGIKLYPAGATTNSDAGVSDLAELGAVFGAMQEHDLVLQVHGEDTRPTSDPFDREHIFLAESLQKIREEYPDLRIIIEHATTTQAVQFVRQYSNTAATITPQHLLLNRSDLFRGGLRPHHYCLPVLKREEHRLALLDAATANEQSQFFLGTDSAPHPVEGKHSACGCAGIYSSHAAIELYAEAFDSIGRLENLERFASINGPRFYGLPVNQKHITLKRADWLVPQSYPLGSSSVVPLRAGESVAWQLEQ